MTVNIEQLINTIERELSQSTEASYYCADGTIIGTDVGYVYEWFQEYADVLRKRYSGSGEWLPWKPPYIGMEYSYDTMQCSECGYVMANAKRIPYNFCPNCGVGMRKEEE